MKIRIDLDAMEVKDFAAVPEQLREVLFQMEMLRYHITKMSDENAARFNDLRHEIDGVTQTRGLLG